MRYVVCDNPSGYTTSVESADFELTQARAMSQNVLDGQRGRFGVYAICDRCGERSRAWSADDVKPHACALDGVPGGGA